MLKDSLSDHLEQIRKVVWKITRDQNVIDDITQECCVRIIEKEHLWSQEAGKLSGWINILTRNVTLNYLNREKKVKKWELLDQETPDQTTTKVSEDISEEQIRWVLEQFCHLKEEERDILHMRYYQGLTTVQIAEKLGISQSGASRKISRSIEKLRKYAKKQGLLNSLFPFWFSIRKNYESIPTGTILVKTKFKITALIILSIVGIFYFILKEKDPKNMNSNIAFFAKNKNGHSQVQDKLKKNNFYSSQEKLKDENKTVFNDNTGFIKKSEANEGESLENTDKFPLILEGKITLNDQPFQEATVSIALFNGQSGYRLSREDLTGISEIKNYILTAKINKKGYYKVSGNIPGPYQKIIKIVPHIPNNFPKKYQKKVRINKYKYQLFPGALEPSKKLIQSQDDPKNQGLNEQELEDFFQHNLIKTIEKINFKGTRLDAHFSQPSFFEVKFTKNSSDVDQSVHVNRSAGKLISLKTAPKDFWWLLCVKDLNKKLVFSSGGAISAPFYGSEIYNHMTIPLNKPATTSTLEFSEIIPFFDETLDIRISVNNPKVNSFEFHHITHEQSHFDVPISNEGIYKIGFKITSESHSNIFWSYELPDSVMLSFKKDSKTSFSLPPPTLIEFDTREISEKSSFLVITKKYKKISWGEYSIPGHIDYSPGYHPPKCVVNSNVDEMKAFLYSEKNGKLLGTGVLKNIHKTGVSTLVFKPVQE